jgi:hypothetical protein
VAPAIRGSATADRVRESPVQVTRLEQAPTVGAPSNKEHEQPLKSQGPAVTAKRPQFIRWYDRDAFAETLYRRFRITQSAYLEPFRKELRSVARRLAQQLEDDATVGDELLVNFKPNRAGDLVFIVRRKSPTGGLEYLSETTIGHDPPHT